MASVCGLELLYHTVARDLQSKDDAVVCAVHWYMLINGFKCIGTQSEVVPNPDQVANSEMLPANWNQNQGLYTLQYVFADPARLTGVILLNIIRVDGNLLVNAFNSDNERTASMTIVPSDFIGDELQNFTSLYRNPTELGAQFQTEILASLYPPAPQPPASTAAPPRSGIDPDHRVPDSDPLRIGPPRLPPVSRGWGFDPLRVGHADLDPLGRFGQGMLMDPRQRFPGRGPPDHSSGIPGYLPRGSVPPGARFDPFGPTNPDVFPRGRGGGPDPDHMKPPDYDDMFS